MATALEPDWQGFVEGVLHSDFSRMVAGQIRHTIVFGSINPFSMVFIQILKEDFNVKRKL